MADIEQAALEAAEAAPKPQPERRLSRRQLVWRRFLRNRVAVVGGLGIIFLVFLAIAGPSLMFWKFDDIDVESFLTPPSQWHPLGTTQAGRDVLALTMRGLGKSLLIGFLVALASTTLAALVGASAAYLGGWYEKSMLWIIDLLLVVPSFFLIAIASKGAPQGDAAWMILALLLALFAWPLSARVVRSLTLSIREREYVMAAKFMGLGAFRIIVRHILPNASSLLIIDATLGVGYAILAETGLSFFGFGVQPPDTSLGTLIGEGATMATTYPWVFLGPSAVLVFLVLCVNGIGDGLRDALDPTSASGGQA